MDPSVTRIDYPPRLHELKQPYEPGVRIGGKYRLESLLGEGGMGTVWLARNETLDSPVALKLVRPGMQNEDNIERLLLEARVEAKLRHPNIVRVFDFARTELGDAFIVMEVLDGISLGAALKELGRLEPHEAVRMALPVIGALCYAHQNGVVHRDLKPQNIFLDRGGLHAGTKLLDFGIAKLMGSEAHRHFTPGGTLIGSLAYMSPEQICGSADVDHRTDIWAMCVVVYEAIAGCPAFSGEGYEVLKNIVESEAPALEDASPAGDALWRILSRGLEKDPSCRFQSMREMGTALAQWLCDQGETEDLDGNRISRIWGVAPSAVGTSARAKPRSDATSLARARRRPRRDVQFYEFPPDTPSSLVRALQRHGIRDRAVLAVRVIAVCACVLAVVLVPSKIRVEGAKNVSSGSPHPSAAAQQSSTHTARSSPIEPQTSNAAPAPALAARSERESQEPRSPKRTTRRLTERDLGLKVPY